MKRIVVVLGLVAMSIAGAPAFAQPAGSTAPAAAPNPPVQALPPDEFPESLSRMPRTHIEEFNNDEERNAWLNILKIRPATGDNHGSLGPTGTRSHLPLIADEYRKIFALFQTELGLAPAELEFNVLLASRFANDETEWGDHIPLAKKANIPDDVVEMIRLNKYDMSKLDDKQKASVALVKELSVAPPQRVDSKTFKQLQDAYGQKGALAVTLLMAYYYGNGIILHVYDQKVDLSTRTRPFPDLEKVERKD